MAGRTSWWPKDAAFHRRELIVELGEEFASEGPNTIDVICAWAQEQRSGGVVRGGFRTLTREAFVTVNHAEAIVAKASEIGILDDLEVDPDGRRFTCRVSGWGADQERGRAAVRQEDKRNRDLGAVEQPVTSSDVSRPVTPSPLPNQTREEQEKDLAATPLRGARGQTSRSQAETVECPRCGAAPGAKCQGVRAIRESAHLERHHAVGELLHLPPKKEPPGATGPKPYKPDPWATKIRDEHFPEFEVSSIEGAAASLKFRRQEPTIDALRALLTGAAA
jgi:hypothetical protein